MSDVGPKVVFVCADPDVDRDRLMTAAVRAGVDRWAGWSVVADRTSADDVVAGLAAAGDRSPAVIVEVTGAEPIDDLIARASAALSDRADSTTDGTPDSTTDGAPDTGATP